VVPVARRAIPTLVSLASLVVVLAVPVSGEEYALRDHGSGLTTVWFYDPNTMGSQLPSNWKDYLWVGKPTSVALGFELTGTNCTSYFDSPFAHDIVGRLAAQGFDVTSVDYAEANGPVSSPDDLLNAANRSGTPLTLAGLSLRVTDGTSTYYLIPCYGGSDRVPYYLDEDSWPAKDGRTVIWVPTTSGPVPFLLRGADEPNAILVAERPGSERLDLDGDGNPDVDLSGLAALRLGLNLPDVYGTSLYMLYFAVGGVLRATFHVVYKGGIEEEYTRTLYGWTEDLAPEAPLVLDAVSPHPGARQRIPVKVYAVEVPLEPLELEQLYVEIEAEPHLPFHPPCMVWMLALTIRTVTGDYLLVQGPDLYYEVSPDEHLLSVRFHASDVELSGDSMKLKLHVRMVGKGVSVSIEGVDLAFLDRDGTTLAVTPSEGELEGDLLNSLRSTGVWDSDEITLSHPNGDIAQHLPAIIILRVTGSTELTDNHGNTSQFTVMACPREVDVLPLSFECRISQTEWRQNGDEAIVRGTVTVDHLTSPGANTVHWIAVTRDWSGAEVVLGEGSTEFPGGLLVPCSVDFTTRGPAAILRTGFDVRVSVGYFERLGGTVGYETAPVILPLTPRVLTVDDVEVTKTVESDGTKELIVLIVTVRFTPPDGPFILDRVDVIVRDESGNIVGERTLDSPIPENDSITVDVPLDDDVSRASVEVTLAGRDGQGIRYQVTRYEKFVGDLSVGVLGTDLRVENGSLEGAVEVGIYVPTEGTLKVTCDGQPLPISIDGGAPSAQPQRLKEGAHRVSLVIPAGTHEISFEFTSPTDRVVKRYEWKIPAGFAEDPVVYQVGFDHGTGEATLYVSSRVGDGVLRIPYDGGVYERKFEYSRELVVNGRRVAELRSDVELVRVSVPEDPYGSLDVKLVLEGRRFRGGRLEVRNHRVRGPRPGR